VETRIKAPGSREEKLGFINERDVRGINRRWDSVFCFDSHIEEAFWRGAQIVDFLGTSILWRQESKSLVPEKKSWDL